MPVAGALYDSAAGGATLRPGGCCREFRAAAAALGGAVCEEAPVARRKLRRISWARPRVRAVGGPRQIAAMDAPSSSPERGETAEAPERGAVLPPGARCGLVARSEVRSCRPERGAVLPPGRRRADFVGCCRLAEQQIILEGCEGTPQSPEAKCVCVCVCVCVSPWITDGFIETSQHLLCMVCPLGWVANARDDDAVVFSIIINIIDCVAAWLLAMVI